MNSGKIKDKAFLFSQIREFTSPVRLLEVVKKKGPKQLQNHNNLTESNFPLFGLEEPENGLWCSKKKK